MNWGRWTLALAYLLASLLAQGVHVHDTGANQSFLEDKGDCDESGRHVASHEVANPGDSPTVCPSCQLRSQASLLVSAPRPIPGLSVLIPLETSHSETLPGVPLRTRCRAPPLA